MSTTRKIAHNTASQIAGKIASTLLGLLAIGMMTRHLGAEQFGWYITVIAFLQFAGILSDFGLIPVTAQMLSEDNPPLPPLQGGGHEMISPPPSRGRWPKAGGGYATSILQNLLGFRLVTSLVVYALAPLIALLFPYPAPVKIAIAFTSISFLCIALNQALIGFFQTRLKMHLNALAEFVGRAALVFGLWLAIRGSAGFLPVMWVVVLGSVSYTAVLWLFARRETRLGFAFDTAVWKKIIRKSWPIAVSIVFNVVYLKGDTLILSLLRSQSEVGLYGAAYRVIDLLTATAMMLMGVMLPILAFNWSRRALDEFSKRYQQAFDAMMLFALPITVGTALLADDIMRVVAGADFAGAGTALRVLALAVLGLYVGAVFGHTAVAIDRQKQTMWIYISDAVLTLLGYLFFIPRFGMMGAAWMTVFSEVYAGVLLWAVVAHHVRIPIRLGAVVKIAAASVVMGAALVAFSSLHIATLIPLGAAVYTAMLLAFGAVNRQMIKGILRKT